jgi:dihydropyrimidine dehydrogenase (NAD+) subunit PreA
MINFCGVELKNPMVIASSPLTSRVKWLIEAEKRGAAAASTKLTFIKQPFYGKLRMHTYLNNGSIICYDRRKDMEESLRLIDETKKKSEIKLFANITHDGEDMDGWALLAKKHEEVGADFIEANMICPNVGLSTRNIRGLESIKSTEHGGAITGQNPEKIAKIVKVLKESVKIPVVVKLTPNVADIGVTAKAAESAGADAVCVAGAQSTLPLVDIYNNGKPGYHLLKGVSHGSLGGPATKLMGFSMVANIAKKTDFPIIGGGGLETYEDCIMMMMWGAKLVTVCTSVMWYGWDIVEKAVKGMETYMEKMGYASYDQIVGMSLNNLRSSSDLEALEGWPEVDKEKCIGCGKCEKPGHCDAIEIINKKSVITADKCLGCGICVSLCPTKAISMHYVEQA